MNHEMNRCIQCYRCVRFYREYAGGNDLNAFRLRRSRLLRPARGGALESEFSGNLVEVCPTGVFTDKTLKRTTRANGTCRRRPPCACIAGWLQHDIRRALRHAAAHSQPVSTARSTATFSAIEGGMVMSSLIVKSEFASHMIRRARGGQLEAASQHSAIEKLKELLAESSAVIGIGSPRASLEANFALRSLVGPEHFFQGVWPSEKTAPDALWRSRFSRRVRLRSPSLHEVQLADACLCSGKTCTNVAPMLALALRQSVRHKAMTIAERLRIPE